MFLRLRVLHLVILCCSGMWLAQATPTSAQTASIIAERHAYLDAKKAMAGNRHNEYQQLRKQLANYPLLPYLDYQELRRQLTKDPYQKIDTFLDQHNNTYLGNLLLRQWLSHLASHKRWHDYRSYFDTTLKSAAHQCLYIWSHVQTGEPQALTKVAALWNVANSQPDECDPLFKVWQESGYLTEDIVWERYQKAIVRRNNASLKRYLKRLMSAKTRTLAQKFERVMKTPELLENINDYQNNHPYSKAIVYQGLKKYIRLNSDGADKLWQKYQSTFTFSAKEKKDFYYSLAKRYAFDDNPPQVQKRLGLLPAEQQTQLIEIVIRERLKRRDWLSVSNWISQLPEIQQSSDRWQYWRAKAEQSLGKPSEFFFPIHEKLANTRSFYGFLSADFLNKPYNLQHSPTIIEQQTLQLLKEKPALLRARELFFLGKLHDARQEWSYATAQLSAEEYQGVAQIAYEWGWHRKSIESMAAATAWDDLSIRFPLAYKMIIQQQAKKVNLPATLIFAIARQESAWETDATSSAGAMGLMQLMPRTARETALKAGITHNKKALFQPEHNITLGSRYISELLGKYNNNRVPAIAAYNAGPHRVNRWLEESANKLPYDVWIEVIPFGETRKYVQNVLSYAVVYGYQTGKVSPLLTQVELGNL